jgi:hypothetical protein
MQPRTLTKTLAALSVICALSMTARAQVGSGWTEVFPARHMQMVGCVTHSGTSSGTETFSITCNNGTDEERSEERVENDFGSGTRQFEGFVKVTSLAGNGVSLYQTKSVNGGTWLMVAVKHDGTLYTVNGGTTVATGVVGVTERLNTVTDCGVAKTYTYVNGSLKATLNNVTAPFYDKYGTYRLGSGNGPITAQWSSTRFWQNGSISGGGGGGTTVSFEAENLSVVDSGTGHSTQTDANSSNGTWISLDAENTGSWMEFTTGNISAGTYSVRMMWKGNNTRGQLSLKVDGTQVGGTLDQYSSAQSYPTTTFGNVTFSSSGTHKIRLTVTGQNGSSSGFILSADKFSFVAQ